MLLKRATSKLHKDGISKCIEVHKGCGGYYVADNRLKKYSTVVHKSAEQAINAFLQGERPVPITKK